MSTTETQCRGACPPVPESLVRLRYFFGKRLGVADFRDEQSYHRSKQRLHNRHAHGSGVLCGLALAPFGEEAADSAVIRVTAGAALDTCGREIIVGHAQCIDLAAWLARKRAAAEANGETFPPAGAVGEGHILALCIAVRYRECESTPESAPRDPCACDSGGCEFGRIEEGFELGVLLAEEAAPYLTSRPRFPPVAELAEIVAAASDPEDLLARLAAAQTTPCPEARDPDWVVLGCLGLALNPDHSEEQGLTAAQTWSPPPATLLSTAAIQELLALLLSCAAAPTEEAAGWTFGGFIAIRPGTDGDLVLRLIPERAILEESVPRTPFLVRRWRPEGGWTRPRRTRARVVRERDRAILELDFERGFLAPGGRYRLTTVMGAQPIVDSDLRPLRIERGFEIRDQGAAGPALVDLSAPH